ncbi:MAG: 4Fe-4S binding protein [Candidatus Omnitrophota bacterium]
MRIRYPKIRELKEALRSIFSRPYTNKFPFAPHIPFERFRGRPSFNEEYCIGCTACAQVCPAKAISFKDADGKRRLTVRWDRCIFCGQCQANCPPEKGIVLSNEFDLATTGKRQELRQSIDKDLAFCPCCGEMIAPLSQIAWVAKRIGPLTFSNASLMLFMARSAGLSSPEKKSPEKKEPGRADRMRVLCPRCRREAVIRS